MLAVEWLEIEIVKLENKHGIPGEIYQLCEQAKEMEKEQAERMYSEDEVDELVNNLISNFKNYNGSSIDNEKLKWFYQQLKNK